MRNLFITILLCISSCNLQPMPGNILDDSAVTNLLSLIESIATKNAGYEQVFARLDSLPRSERESTMISLRSRNARDPELRDMIDDLLDLEAYRIYFGRFTNVTPDHFRLAFNALPYDAPNLPGGIADAFYELMHHRSAFGKWYESVRGEMSVEKCVRVAQEWLPPGEHRVDKVYLIYDGNAGSFAEQGSAFFNLCSEVISKTSKGRRFAEMHEIGISELEGVIAHELHHVMAEPILYPENLGFASWEERWKDRITRSIVSEGIAFQCNPLTGFQKVLWEDRGVVSSLIREINRTMLALDHHETTEDSIREWYGRLFQEYAMSLLEEYLKKGHQGSDVRTLAKERAIFRPDLVHALGWWMISRITGNGTKKREAIAVLTNPSLLYTFYNATLEADMDDLAVDPLVVAMFSGK